MEMNKVKAAVFTYGGPAKLSKAMGISRVTVHTWTRRGWVPIERISDFCLRTGLRPSDANPELYQRAKEIVRLEGDFENRNR